MAVKASESNVLSVKSSSCAAVVKSCGGSCGGPWGAGIGLGDDSSRDACR